MTNPFKTPQQQRLALAFTVLLGLLTITLAVKWQHSSSERSPVSLPVAAATPQALPKQSTPEAASAGNFRNWLEEFKDVGNDPAGIALLERGKKLAEQRRERMARLIREDPQQALKEALSFDEYESLPKDIRPLVEKPFSVKADYRYYPVCGDEGWQRPPGAPDHFAEIDMPDGSTLSAFTWGQRSGVTSKRGMPMQGIMLDGVAALQDGVLRELTPTEVPAAMSLFGNVVADGKTSFASGNPITGNPVYAVLGGELVAFADRNELQTLNRQLAKLDELPGPRAGSSVVYLPYLVNSSGVFNLAEATLQAQALSNAWTNTKKKYFLIRVDFSDQTGEPVTQSSAIANLNGVTSATFLEMSYGKTWIEAAVSANLYRLPQPSSYYSGTSNSNYNTDPAFSSKTGELLRDARNTFRSAKSGSDAAINIGPTDNTGTGGTGGLGDYDIVGVFFSSVGMKSGGAVFSGLSAVSGADSWFQGANENTVYVHELGHNYGLEHASFWLTTDGSVVGVSGTSIEYGDCFDIMGAGTVPQGQFQPQSKVRLNWLDNTQWADASASGTNAKTYRIYRGDSSLTSGSTRGVRVTKAATLGSEEYYWLGYRALYPNNPHALRGAYLTWQRPGKTRCWLLDTTPLTPSAPPITGDMSDAPLDLGRTYADTTANVFFTPVAVGGAGGDQYIDVQVNIGPFPGNQSPTATAITGSSTVLARNRATFSVTATDPNGDALAYSWNTHDGSVNDNSNTLTHSWMVSGTYAITLTVSDMKGGSTTLTKTITVTDPVDTWTQNTVGTTDALWDVIYAKGRFVAVDYLGAKYVGGGLVYMSWDGITWTPVATPPAFERDPHLAFGNNVFVMGGNGGSGVAQIAYSLDGAIWTTANFPSGVPQIREVAFGGGKFLAIADGGNVLSSTDGITWSGIIVNSLPNFRHVAWDGAAWVATALDTAGTMTEIVWTSADGLIWTQQSALGVNILKVFAHTGTVYAIGEGAGVMYSIDHGITWHNAQMPDDSAWSAFSITVADDGTLLCTAATSVSGTAVYSVLVSTDGRVWSRTTADYGSVASSTFGITYGAGKFLTVGNNGVTRYTSSLYPANTAPSVTLTTAPATGKARQLIHFAASATDANGDPLTYTWDFGSQVAMQDGASIAQSFPFGGTISVVVRVTDGKGGVTTGTSSIIVSDPARNFTQRSSGTASNLTGIAANSNIAVAVGGIIYGSANSSGGYPCVILSSSDGITWTARSVPTYSAYLWFNGITWDGTQFIAVGGDYNFSVSAWVGTLYTSPDGISWTQKYIGTASGAFLQSVASNGQTTVVVGNNGTVLTSTNGSTLTPVAVTGAPATISGIAYGGGTYILTGYSNGNGTPKIFTSTDGLAWTDCTSGLSLLTGADVRKLAWLNDRFVASGYYSMLLTSTSLGQTFTTTRSTYEDTPALAYGDGIYFAAGGIDPDASSTQVDVLSLNGVAWYQFPAPALASPRTGAAFFNHTLLTVGNGGQIWQSGNLLNPFATWQSANFPNGGLSALPESDADHDGVSNFTEYALNRNPNSGSGSNGSLGLGHSVVQSSRIWLHLDMPEPAPSDVNYIIQGVNSLTGTWVDLASKNGTAAWQWLAGGTPQLSLGTTSAGRLSTEIGMPDSAGNPSRYFLRLKVVQP